MQLLRWNKRILLSYSEYLINSVFKQQLMEWSWVGILQAALGWIKSGSTSATRSSSLSQLPALNNGTLYFPAISACLEWSSGLGVDQNVSFHGL